MKKKKKKSGILSTVILILILLAGLSLLLYPTFSEQWNAMHQSRVISGYTEQVSQMDEEKYAAYWQQAQEYNQKLLQRSNPYDLTDELAAEYEECLDIYDNGAMGYLEIPSISCTLAIYHGTDDSVLRTNVGHLEWTSLPVGGESTHCVLSGHRGLPSAELLTNIDRLEIGDVFYLYVLGEKLTYVVDNISVVLPEETEKLLVTPGEDYVTLLTCTPYGINSHRLLVRGTRLDSGNADKLTKLYLPGEVSEISKIYLIPVTLLLIVAAAWLGSFVVKLLSKLRPVKGTVNENEDNDRDDGPENENNETQE